MLRSSTWRELRNLAKNPLSTVLYLFIWWKIVANNMNGMEVTPNKTIQNRNSVNSLFSKFSKLILPDYWSHKNFTKSLCDGRNQFEETPFLYPQQMLCCGSEIVTITQKKLQLKKVLDISNHISCSFHLLSHSRQTLFAILS